MKRKKGGNLGNVYRIRDSLLISINDESSRDKLEAAREIAEDKTK